MSIDLVLFGRRITIVVEVIGEGKDRGKGKLSYVLSRNKG